MSRQKTNQFTTKQLMIPAQRFLNSIADDKQTKYPVEISLKSSGTGISWRVNSREELLGTDTLRRLGSANLTYIRTFEGSTLMEFKKKGKLTVSTRWCPEIAHGTVLTEMETRKLCRFLIKR